MKGSTFFIRHYTYAFQARSRSSTRPEMYTACIQASSRSDQLDKCCSSLLNSLRPAFSAASGSPSITDLTSGM